jgi:hypothetical protein
MSKFYTPIAVDLKAVKELLPKGAFLHGVTFNEEESRVEVHWEDDRLATGLDHAVEFTGEQLDTGKVPKQVAALRSVRTKSRKAAAGSEAGE